MGIVAFVSIVPTYSRRGMVEVARFVERACCVYFEFITKFFMYVFQKIKNICIFFLCVLQEN